MSEATTPSIDPDARRFARALTELYGPALDRVVLFGSRARGDAAPDADYDIAVFLRTMKDRRIEWDRLADLRRQVLDDGGPFLDAIPFRASDYDARTPLMHDIRQDGVTL